MSRFLSKKFDGLVPYVPGEQPKDRGYIKLNANESPYPPAPGVQEAAVKAAAGLQLYADPDCRELRRRLAEFHGISPDTVSVTNGSDIALAFIIRAFGDKEKPFVWPDMTYSFYPILSRYCGVPFTEIPLRDDFTIELSDYEEVPGNMIIANPNAPTGIAMDPEEIAGFARRHPERLLIVDEAYVDFGARSCIPFTQELDNLIVVQTYSKARSFAGGRLGVIIGAAPLITDLETLRNSVDPFNVNSMTIACGIASLDAAEYYRENCRKITETRAITAQGLERMGFTVLPSSANFVFAKHPALPGDTMLKGLRERGILIRHFSFPRIIDWNRITIGTPEQMRELLKQTEDLLKEVNS